MTEVQRPRGALCDSHKSFEWKLSLKGRRTRGVPPKVLKRGLQTPHLKPFVARLSASVLGERRRVHLRLVCASGGRNVTALTPPPREKNLISAGRDPAAVSHSPARARRGAFATRDSVALTSLPGAAVYVSVGRVWWPCGLVFEFGLGYLLRAMESDFYLRYYVGHKGKFGHEFLEFEFRPDGESGLQCPGS